MRTLRAPRAPLSAGAAGEPDAHPSSAASPPPRAQARPAHVHQAPRYPPAVPSRRASAARPGAARGGAPAVRRGAARVPSCGSGCTRARAAVRAPLRVGGGAARRTWTGCGPPHTPRRASGAISPRDARISRPRRPACSRLSARPRRRPCTAPRGPCRPSTWLRSR
ncbi:hypothetical protein BC834DRAFT_1007272 [Gloeopeniophorella convolvens]|nr:hypothetical protein BC834DRAFT_1007272 [Gloeopeniophorella convolvens]